MYKLILLSVIILAFTGQVKAQFSAYSDFFPLEVGNVWVYRTTYQFFPPTERKVVVTKDTVINSHRYFFRTNSYGFNWVRFDTTSGNILIYAPNNGCSSYPNDVIYDSLPSSIGDVVYCPYMAIYTHELIDTASQNIFGASNIPTREFKLDGLTYGKRTYMKGFGETYSCGGEPPPCQSFTTLKGCVINGVVYGDTLLTNLQNITETLPEEFSLMQNFPNPFNPSTTISFDIPQTALVKLTVYDALGREVATLVNENLTAGVYQYQFSTHNYQLPSGVYFYRLEAGEFVESKRMIILK